MRLQVLDHLRISLVSPDPLDAEHLRQLDCGLENLRDRLLLLVDLEEVEPRVVELRRDLDDERVSEAKVHSGDDQLRLYLVNDSELALPLQDHGLGSLLSNLKMIPLAVSEPGAP